MKDNNDVIVADQVFDKKNMALRGLKKTWVCITWVCVRVTPPPPPPQPIRLPGPSLSNSGSN